MQLNLQDLDKERKRKANELQCQKRKAAEEDIQQLKKKQKTLVNVCSSLEKDVLKRQRGSLMALLISKSNAMRRRLNEKGGFIAKKVVQLGHIKKCFGAKYSNSQYLQCL